MSKFSSFKSDQILFENWRKHISEAVDDDLLDAATAIAQLEPGEQEKIADLIGNEEDNMLQEDGHTDVASAMRKMKVVCENAEDLLQTLSRMQKEDDLPSWWMSKAALAANYISKMRDYLIHPTGGSDQIPLVGEKRDTVSKEISKLRRKGKPRDQAVAIALSMKERGDI